MNDFGLTPLALSQIRGVFARHPRAARVRVFGSRATGRFRPNSDIDLAVWGDLDPLEIARIAGELDDLPLPYLFDVVHYESLTHPALARHIDEHGKDL